MYPLTSAQRDIWLEQQAHGESVPLYNIGSYLRFPVALDRLRLEAAATALVKDHDVLRLILVEARDREGLPQQAFRDPFPVSLPLHDFAAAADPRAAATAWMHRRLLEPFCLWNHPLFRYDVLRLGPQEYLWFGQYHHLIVDGWAAALLARSLVAHYRELHPGTAGETRPQIAPPSYRQAIEADQAFRASEAAERQRRFWREELPGPPEPLYHPRPAAASGAEALASGQHRTQLSGDLFQRMQAFAAAQGVSPAQVFLAAVFLYGARVHQRDEVVIGVPVQNRRNARDKAIVGLFMGIRPVRVVLPFSGTFVDLVRTVQRRLRQVYRHPRLPITDMLQWMPHRGADARLFDVSVSYEAHSYAADLGDGSTTEGVRVQGGLETTPLAISVQVYHEDQDIPIDWVYNRRFLTAEAVAQWAEGLHRLLERGLNSPETSIAELDLLSPAEAAQLTDWGWGPAADAPADVVTRFEAQVAARPEAPAVVADEETLSYAGLNARANRLAYHLIIAYGIGPDRLVAVALERSVDLVVGLLAVLKAGGAYLPLDPEAPAARLETVLADGGAELLLSQRAMVNLPEGAWPRLDREDWPAGDDTPAALASEPRAQDPAPRAGPEDLAYVIYTSGSTGRPKGVMVPRRALANFLDDMATRLGLAPGARSVALTTLAFDIAALELYLPLVTGACIALLPRAVAADGPRLRDHLAVAPPALIQATPATWQMLRASGWRQAAPLTALCGGERLDPDLASWLRVNSDRLWNVYGPTETTVWSTAHEVTARPEVPERIGRPLANTRVYVLDAHGQPLPPGVAGELAIAGAGLARGYRNRPALTAERFVTRELLGRRERVYRTGDQVRWAAEGELEFLGRLDHQVKLRGYRIELGEIEAALSTHGAVQEAAVVLAERGGTPVLAAYVSLWEPVTPATLRAHLEERLPGYMVPASYTVVSAFPRTASGKLDRRTLPEPQWGAAEGAQPLRTETERLLAALWSGLLGPAVTDRQAHFFELGGHSLLATQLLARVREGLGIDMPLRWVFESPGLEAMAAALEQAQRTEALPPIEAQPPGHPAVLSYAQQRLWFLDQLEGASATYNIPAALGLSGPLDVEGLQAAAKVLVARHDSLRTRFPAEAGAPAVVVGPPYDPLTMTDLRAYGAAARAEAEQRAAVHARTPFDLAEVPLWRLELLRVGAEEWVLLFNIHHIIADGWSLGVLLQEWSALYRAHIIGDAPALPALPIRYTDYALWQQRWLAGGALERQLAYWVEALAGAPQRLELPADHPRPAVQSYRGARLRQPIDGERTAALKAFGQARGATLFMTLFSAFAVLLYRYTGQDDLLIGSPIANRTQSETEPLVGLFVNTLVLRARLHGELRFTECLAQVRRMTLGAYAHQALPFETLVERLNPERSLSHSPLFQVMFVLQNTGIAELDLPGVAVDAVPQEVGVAKFDLTLNVIETAQGLELEWEYATDRFEQPRIARMAGHFAVLLDGLLAQPETPVHALPLLTDAERVDLERWGTGPVAEAPGDLVARFEAQAAARPTAPAVVADEETLSYAGLNARSNRLAHHLINAYGIGPDRLVGLYLEPSAALLVGLLGILKAGGAYVPLEPGYPVERIRYMIGDSAVPVIVTREGLAAEVPGSAPCVLVDDPRLGNRGESADPTGVDPTRQAGPDDLVYGIYTSGSTGQPKGTLINHGGFSQLLEWYIRRLGLSAADRTLIVSPIGFDLTQKNLFAPLLVGGQVHFTRSAPLDVPGMRDVIAHHGITWLNCAPSAFYPLVEGAPQPRAWTKLSSLRWVVLGGEPIALERLRDWLEYPETRARIMNSYGPTESTDVVAAYVPDDPLASGDGAALAIGYPLPGYRIYLLDAFQQPVPPGLPGEVCIAGPGLARGYHRRPDLTEQAFVTAKVLGHWERLYRTGDRAWQRPDGAMIYLGRMDSQVKVRGQRIELAEVERAIRHQPEVREAVATVVETDSDHRLVAYLVPALGAESGDLGEPAFDEADLMNRLRGCLPAAMVPNAFVRLSELPLTPNGKIDRGALPPPAADPGRITPSVEPRDETERALVGIWEDLLGVRGLGIHDSFFDLGGHSLLAIRLLGRIEQRWHQCLPVATLFDAPTIAGLADRLRQDVPPSLRLTLRPGQHGPRIYCLPGALGDTFYFRDLLAQLPAGQPVLGLQSPGVDADQPRPTGLERHAAMLVALIDGLEGDEPMGPPLLVGHSMGGIVAFEIARQREQRGHRVGLVVIVDTPAQVDPRWAERVEEMTEGEWMGAIATELTRRPVETLGLEARVLDGLDEHARWARLRACLQEAGVFPADTDPARLRRWVERYRANTQNALAYRPSDAIEAPIVLVRGKDSIAALETQSEDTDANSLAKRRDWGWQAYAQQTVTVIDAPGDHTSVMEQPQVARWAERLTPFVTTAKNDAGSP